MTRIITHLGFGSYEPIGGILNTDVMEVTLDEPFLGEKKQMVSRRERFTFSPWGVIRVINVGGVGILSNLQFLPGVLQEAAYLHRLQVPPDETHFVFDLETCAGKVWPSQSLGLAADNYLIMRPWIDRWGRENNPLFDGTGFDSQPEALRAFEQEIDRLAGATGISSMVLYSVQEQKILRLCIAIAPPQGIVYNWKAPGL